MANIEGVNPPVLNDTDYVDKIEDSLNAIDAHDHTATKGAQIPAGGIATGAITEAKHATVLANASKFLERNASGEVVSNVHAVPTGAVVGTTDSQILTNKTIDGDDNTVQDLPLTAIKTNLTDASKFIVRDASGIPISNTKAVPTGVVVGDTDSQTLTNKTLTAPSITTPTIDIPNLTEQGSTPATPAAGTTKLYAKSDGLIYKLASDGVEDRVGVATPPTIACFTTDCTWTVPLGVTEIRITAINTDAFPRTRYLSHNSNQSTSNIIARNGELYSWGGNGNGAVGDGSATTRCCPVRLCPTVAFKCLVSHTTSSTSFPFGIKGFALDCESRLYTWGANTNGVLGLGCASDTCVPTLVCSGLSWKQIETAGTTTDPVFGITWDGRLYSWGNNTCGVLGLGCIAATCVPTAVCQFIRFKCVLSACNGFAFAITDSNTLYAWGNNLCGQLGDGTVTEKCVPTLICGSLQWQQFCTTQELFTIGITSTGALYKWGRGTNGFGDGTTVEKCVPTILCSGTAFKCILHASIAYTAVLGCDNKLYAWGANTCGMLGDGSDSARCSPVVICSSLSWSCILRPGGSATIFGLTTGGCLYTWGCNPQGLLGIGSDSAVCVPTVVCLNKTFTQIAAYSATGVAPRQAVGFTSDCQIYAWGCNAAGFIGDGTTSPRCVPTRECCNLTFRRLVNIGTWDCGSWGVMAFTSSGDLVAWGFGASAGCSTGLTSSACVPTVITLDCGNMMKRVSAVKTGTCYKYLVTTDGDLYSWGAHASGRLGDNSNSTGSSNPFRIFIPPMVGAKQAKETYNLTVTPGNTYCITLSTRSPAFDSITLGDDTNAVLVEYVV